MRSVLKFFLFQGYILNEIRTKIKGVRVYRQHLYFHEFLSFRPQGHKTALDRYFIIETIPLFCPYIFIH